MSDYERKYADDRKRDGEPAITDEGAFQLGPWQVEPRRNRIAIRDDETGAVTVARTLEPRLMRLLCHLASRPGEVFEREELIAILWPRVVVNENSLTRAVSDLRRILQPPLSTGSPRPIETIPKTGYRLRAPVSELAATPEPDRPSLTTAARALARIHRHTAWTAATASLAGAAIAATLTWVLSIGMSPTTLPISADAGQDRPTGDRIVDSRDYGIAPSGGNWLSTTMQQSGGTASEGPENRIDNRVEISPNGKWFAYTRYTDSGSQLLVGNTRLSRAPVEVFQAEAFIDNLQWAPVGDALLFTTAQRAELTGGNQAARRLMLLDLQTMQAREIHRSGPQKERDKSGTST